MKPKAECKLFLPKYSLNLNGRLIDFDRPKVMGILNVTPDSFFDGGQYKTQEEILTKVGNMLEEGADFVDVGGYSTRPGAALIPIEEELKRVIDAIRVIKKQFPSAILSIDTFRSEVARIAVNEGASMVNDVSGGTLDDQMIQVVAALQVPYILMHMRGTPETMTSLTGYENLIVDVIKALKERILLLQAAGVNDIIVDPGFGFAKTIKQNFEMLDSLNVFAELNRPMLVGLSRKSMIWKTLTIEAGQALNGTSILNTIALSKGVAILRVHDVKAASECVTLMQALKIHTNDKN